MNFEKLSNIENTEKSEGRMNIESDGSMSVSECKEYWKKRFEGVGEYGNEVDSADKENKEIINKSDAGKSLNPEDSMTGSNEKNTETKEKIRISSRWTS